MNRAAKICILLLYVSWTAEPERAQQAAAEEEKAEQPDEDADRLAKPEGRPAAAAFVRNALKPAAFRILRVELDQHASRMRKEEARVVIREAEASQLIGPYRCASRIRLAVR